MADDGKQETPEETGYALTPEEQKKRRQRNLALGLGLAAFMIIVFFVTIFRLGAAVAERSS